MLHVISPKLAQRTPGDLSIPATDQEVLQPYKSVARFVSRELAKRRQEKLKGRFRNVWESRRNPANGPCPVCREDRAIDERGRHFCPDPACNLPRYSIPR